MDPYKNKVTQLGYLKAQGGICLPLTFFFSNFYPLLACGMEPQPCHATSQNIYIYTHKHIK